MPVVNNLRASSSTQDMNTSLQLAADNKADNLDSIVHNHIICSTYDSVCNLPYIKIKCKDQYMTTLIDTGSTLSLIDSGTLQAIKKDIQYKYLASRVHISTINSVVDFTGCIMLSFKIDKLFFQHQFYITDIHNESFEVILGFDFIKKHSVSITPSFNSILIKDVRIPFIGNHEQGNCNYLVQGINAIHAEKSSTQTTHMSDFANTNTNQLHEQDPSGRNAVGIGKIQVEEPNYSKNFTKAVIQPNSMTYVKVKYLSEPTEYFLFLPTFNSKELVFHTSIHALSNIKENFFLIAVQNKANYVVHLNKNAVLGKLINIDKEDIEEYTFGSEEHFCNLIKASKETIQKRIDELSPSDFDLTHLNEQQQQIMKEMLCKKAQVFSKSLKTLGHTDLVEPHINLLQAHPLKALPFPVPQALEQEALTQIQEMIDAGIVERSNSSWACPMLLVKKKRTDITKPQTYRLALDLRLLNAIIIPSAYPLPKISNLLVQLSKYKYFSTLDLPSAYWQIAVPKHLQDKLSFTTPWGIFTYKRLVFGLRMASATFQQLIDTLIQMSGVDSCFAYQDDIVVGANSFEEMVDKLQTLMDTFIQNNVTLSPVKSSFFKTDINFLGFNIKNNKIFPIESNIQKIVAFPKPRTKRQVKGFIGVCSFYRSLIPSFAELVAPLIHITKPKVKFVWESEQENAFQNLQKIFFHKPVLHLPNWNENFYLNTDASKNAIAAILMQKKDDTFFPIAYFSKILSEAEKKYPSIKLELYAIYKGITSFKYYLFNRKFTVLSDAKPLDKYKKSSSPADVTTRWLMELSEYSFNFVHIPGTQNILADFLSRCSSEPITEDILSNPQLLSSDEVLPVVNKESDLHNDICNQLYTAEETVPHKVDSLNTSTHYVNTLEHSAKTQDPLLEISDNTIFIEQQKDTQLTKIIKDLQEKKNHNKTKNYYINPENKLLCYCKNVPEESQLHRAVLPRSLLFKALTIAHISHTGICKTLQNIRKRFTWKNMIADTCNFVNSCEICIQHKHHKLNKAPFLAAPIPTAPNQKISVDILGPIKGTNYLLTIVDIFSRHLELYTLNNISAQAVTKALLHYIATHGRPQVILSDQGSQFTSEFLKIFTRNLGISLKHVALAHPQANGISERVNTQIKSSIHTMGTQGFDIVAASKIHQSIYNSTIHPATKFTPNHLHFGRELTDIYQNYKINKEWKISDTSHEIQKLTNLLDILYTKAYINNETSRQELYRNSRQQSKFKNIKVNDKVFIKFPNIFDKKIQGPYVVQKVISPVIMQVKLISDDNASPILIHTNRIIKLERRKNDLNEKHPDPNISIPNVQQDINVSHDQQNVPSTSNNTGHSKCPVPGSSDEHKYQLRKKHRKYIPNNDYFYY